MVSKSLYQSEAHDRTRSLVKPTTKERFENLSLRIISAKTRRNPTKLSSENEGGIRVSPDDRKTNQPPGEKKSVNCNSHTRERIDVKQMQIKMWTTDAVASHPVSPVRAAYLWTENPNTSKRKRKSKQQQQQQQQASKTQPGNNNARPKSWESKWSRFRIGSATMRVQKKDRQTQHKLARATEEFLQRQRSAGSEESRNHHLGHEGSRRLRGKEWEPMSGVDMVTVQQQAESKIGGGDNN